jgi:hypothetical protein
MSYTKRGLFRRTSAVVFCLLLAQGGSKNVKQPTAVARPRRASFDAACFPVASNDGVFLPASATTACKESASIELSRLLKISPMRSAITISFELTYQTGWL